MKKRCFINVDAPYDKEHHAARYSFTQCPNATFAKKHGLLHVLPLLCNSDFFGIGEIHGTLIRCGTCGNSDQCDYLVVGNRNPIAEEYETVPDELGFLISRKKEVQTECRRQFMAQPIHAATPQFIGTFLTALSFYRPIIAVIIGLN